MKVNSQVGISKNLTFQSDPRTQLHVKQDNYAVRLPIASSATVLPVSLSGTSGDGTQGSVIFNRETGSIVQNDGTSWKISDPIVTTVKNNKIARFIRNGTVTTTCQPCTILSPCIGGSDRDCAAVNVPFTSNTPSINEISNDVSLISPTSNIISFKTRGLYKLSFKSGALDIGEATCVGATTNLYSRLNLEISSDNGASWKPINNTVSNSTGGLLSLGSIPLGSVDVGHSLAFTYVGVFNQGDRVRLRFFGNQTMSVGGCLGYNMYFAMNTTGNSVSEIIVEKINM
ncbi:hypothetical protein C1637_22770 [Chryseobacterium lactis]|uniref:Exo-alpha-sialidase n=2 Tax=Chryseobacterium lactis TaxID=1241981 RepID=A0A3G6RKJ0_CHRLC|nr:hypothetical protein EG342_00565 [Chryseobacterium lactis]AZB05502.1 hypothetical protein EG341_16690 [Chryseobacterium lactis]PNW11363.1 hypothetical protein C1637_22770 [Chryseobacterium lactis]